MGSRRGIARAILRRATLVAGIVALSACTPIYRNHGYAPDDTALSEVLVGIDTRDTVSEVVGQPTAGGVLNDGGFYYVESRFRHFGPLAPDEIERQVVAITFDEGGVVRNIERFGLERGQVVTLSRRVTDDNIADTTFIRQLMGNLGRFDAGDFLGDP